MTRITIPEEDVGGFLDLFNLNDEDFNKLIFELKKLEANTPPFQIENVIKTQTDFNKKDEVASITAKLFVSLVVNEDSTDNLIDSFYSFYEQNEAANPISKEIFYSKFRQLRETTNPTKQVKRISQIKRGRGLYLVSQKIQMHIKPVFSEGNIELLGNVITHQLQLSVDGENEENDSVLSIEIDKEDLIQLKEMLTTSIKQHEILEKKFEEAGVKFLDV